MRHHAAAYTNSCSPVAGELENAAELAERRKALRARRKDHRLSDRELRQDARDLRQDKQSSRQDKREERFASRSEGLVVVGNIWALGAGAAALGAGAWWLSRRYATPAPAPAPAQVVVTEQPTAARIIIDEPATLAEQARALRKTDRGLRQASRAFAAMADDDLDEVDDLDEQILADEAEAGARASLDEIETEGLVHIGNIWGT